jgi:putative membrane-bound dehydrogenase-like protein
MSMKYVGLWLWGCGWIAGWVAAATAQQSPTTLAVGLAKVDITPSYPIRLSGYGNRREESEGVELPIWAKAMAIGTDQEGPAVLITVDNCGIPEAMREEVVAALEGQSGVSPERVAICFSHTHCAPCLSGALVNIFSQDIPPAHQATIDRYSEELTAKLIGVAKEALAQRTPSQLSWAVGQVDFARNRRAAWGGPVDHALPVLFVHDRQGKLRGVYANYACHATTLNFNRIHGDWPGTAMAAIEREYPGVTALVSIGCGADQNPHPRGTVELADRHGLAVAAEVSRLLASERKVIGGPLAAREKSLQLPLESLPSREEYQKLAQSSSPSVAYAAAKNLARLDRGQALATHVAYRVQVWNFADDLAMVFLPGEVTVDYQLRLKIAFDAKRLWVNAYSNDAPCYIPSDRVLKEGGYEGMSAMVYYDRPARFATGLEETIVGAIQAVIPSSFQANYREDVPPKSPADSWMAIQVRPGMTVELVAAEPLVSDPVAIDWDARGRMWVIEQPDYPKGMDGNWKPGGRVKILSDTDGDNRYDRSTLFMDGLPFPTGITCWQDGVFICAAPDILYAKDTDDDGRSDLVEKLFTGFHTENYNARINSLTLGLDHWIHGANGNLGGSIQSLKTGEVLDISGRDIRFDPKTGRLQLVSGVTQQGRARDDWDEWFGCSNSRWIFHFPLQDRYARRNPYVSSPSPSVYLPAGDRKTELHPISEPLERFNNPASLGHVTSANGLGIYRDVLLGQEFEGNAFIGEVAHNLVRRFRLDPQGVTFEAHRPDDEQQVEFLASKDNWTRPVQVRTGRDGALYVVDMYRAVIEHTRWIPADRLAKVDPRAGDTMGRIYRVFPQGAKLRPVQDLTQLSPVQLVQALDTPNGTTRDLIQQLLSFQRPHQDAIEALERLVSDSPSASVRVQSLAILDGWEKLSADTLMKAMHDPHPLIRRQAIRLVESRFGEVTALDEACLQLAKDADVRVRYQLALSLGEWRDPRATAVLGELANRDSVDHWFRAAIASSAAADPVGLLRLILADPTEHAGRAALIEALIATAAAHSQQPADFERLVELLISGRQPAAMAWRMAGLGKLMDALDKRAIAVDTLSNGDKLVPLFQQARTLASQDLSSHEEQEAAIRLLGRGMNRMEEDLPLLIKLLAPQVPDRLQKAALATLARSTDPSIAHAMLEDWTERVPSLRATILSTLLAREAWTSTLLQAMERGQVQAAEITPAQRERLIDHRNPTIREWTQRLLPTRQTADREKVVEAYRAVMDLTPDPVHGAEVFKSKCAACHAYLGQGFAVGPDLKPFYNKSPSDFIVAILNPNAAIEPRYASYVVLTEDGRTLSGVIANETASHFELLQAGGLRETILRSENPQIRATGSSLMPEGLEQGLSPQELADLIGYIKSGG